VRYAFLILILLPILAWGDITISSLPYTCNQADSTYVLSGNLTCNNGDAITISAANITIEGGGDTIWFNLEDSSGTGVNGGGVWGLYLNDVDGCVVESLTIIEDTANDTLGEWAQGIRVGGNDKFTIRDCNVHVKSPNSMNVYCEGATMLLIDGGNYTNYCRSYNNRKDFYSLSIYLHIQGETYQNTDSAYNYKVTGIRIDTCFHGGISVAGISEVSYCTLTVDSRNTRYSYPSGCDTCNSSNSYAIHQTQGDGSPRVHHNICSTGTEAFGGRGIAFGEIATWATDAGIFRCDSNRIYVHRGLDETDGWGLRGYGLRLRSYRNLDSVYIHDNNIYVETKIDTTGSDSSIAYGGAVGLSFSSHGNHWRVYNNHIVAYADSNTYQDNWGNVVAFLIETSDSAGHRDRLSYDNYYGSNGVVIKMNSAYGGGEWGQGSGWKFLRDTLDRYGTSTYSDADDFDGAITSGWYTFNQDSVIIQDVIFTNDDSVHFDVGQAADRELQRIRSVKFLIEDSSGYASDGADYVVIDSSGNGDTVLSGTTGATGLIQDHVTYFFNVWDGDSHEDTTYNDFIIRAIKDNDTVWDTLHITDTTQIQGDSVTATLTFTNLSASNYINISGSTLKGVTIK